MGDLQSEALTDYIVGNAACFNERMSGREASPAAALAFTTVRYISVIMKRA
jgi:hypothetical protein